MTQGAAAISQQQSRELFPLEWSRLDEAARILTASHVSFQASTAAWMDRYILDGEHASTTAAARRRRSIALDAWERAETQAAAALEALQEARRQRHRDLTRTAAQRRKQEAGRARQPV